MTEDLYSNLFSDSFHLFWAVSFGDLFPDPQTVLIKEQNGEELVCALVNYLSEKGKWQSSTTMDAELPLWNEEVTILPLLQ